MEAFFQTIAQFLRLSAEGKNALSFILRKEEYHKAWVVTHRTVLTPAAAFCLGLIMIPASAIHYQRHEKSTMVFNIFILLLCLWTGLERWLQL